MITAEADGVLTRLDAKAVGIAVWRLGAGRAQQSDVVQAGAGVRLHAKPGDRVRAGDRCSPCTPTPRSGSPARKSALEGAWAISDEPVEQVSLVLGRYA